MPPTGKTSGSVRVLLIADSRKTESFVWAALSTRWWGHASLEWKKSLSQALDALKSGAFDAMLVDWAGSDSRSPEALTRIAAVAQKLPVILLVTQEETDHLVNSRNLGIRGWLRKETLTVSRLADEVAHAIEPPVLQKPVPSE